MFTAFFGVFSIIALGILARFYRILPDSSTSVISILVINFSMPALLFSSIQSSDLSYSIIIVPLIAALTTIICVLITLLVGSALRIPLSLLGAFVLGSAFGNTGSFGFPVTLSLYGKGLFPIAVYYDTFGTIIPQTTLGTWISARFGDSTTLLRESFIKVAKFPPLWGAVLGFALRGYTLPGMLQQPITYLGQVTIPLMLISMGLTIRFPKLDKRESLIVGIGVFIKLVISPLLVYGLGRLLSITPDILEVAVVEGGAPSMLFANILAMRYGLNVTMTSNITLLSTLLSSISIPLLIRGLF